MDRLRFLTMIAFGLIFLSCKERRKVINVEDNINEFIQTIDSNQLKALEHWFFVYRGPNGFWQNDSIDNERYNVIYSRGDRGETILVHGPQRFIKDFAIKLQYDTSIFNLKLVKVEDKVTVYTNWDRFVKTMGYSELTNKDPFKYMSELSDLKDKYGLVQISHPRKAGTFIQFYFSTSDLLTFIPDTADINPEFKLRWTKDWSKGKWIDAHWNLRKLEKPIEVGG